MSCSVRLIPLRLILLALLLAGISGCARYDLIIRNGTVYDGSGVDVTAVFDL